MSARTSARLTTLAVGVSSDGQASSTWAWALAAAKAAARRRAVGLNMMNSDAGTVGRARTAINRAAGNSSFAVRQQWASLPHPMGVSVNDPAPPRWKHDAVRAIPHDQLDPNT